MSESIATADAGDDIVTLTTSDSRRLGLGDRPFLRNAYALVLNTGISGALGLAYWVLAARHYNDADVGRGSAAISALMLLTGLVSVNFAGTLNRFIPNTGKRTGAVVAFTYLVTSAIIAVLAVALLVALHWFGGPAYDLIREPQTRMWFVVAAVAASVVTVQDSVLTGLRAAVWVPVWNAAFAVAKIILLLVLARSMPHSGLFFSWIIPMIVVLFPVNLLIFVHLLPRHVRTSTHEATLTGAEIGRFFAADYLGALFLYGTMFVVPVLVATRVSPQTYAYFFLAWAVASMMNLVAVNMAVPMVVEAVHDPARLAGYCRAALGRVLSLLCLGVVVIGLAAPHTLGLLRHGYLDAVPLLQLLAFASLPSAVVDIYLGTLRARSMRGRIIGVQCLRAVSVLGLVLVLQHYQQAFQHFGDPRLTAVGVAVLLGQLVVMLFVLPDLGRLLGWRRRSASPVPTYQEQPCLP